MSIIDSLSAGYRFVTERLHLLLLPVLLDLFLWRSPRLSVEPILVRLADVYRDASQVDGLSSDLVDMADQAATLITEFGEHSNLSNLLVNSSLFHVPSVMVLTEPLPDVLIRKLDNPVNVIVVALVLGMLGLFLGVTYFGLLANRLPIGGGEKGHNLTQFLTLSLRRWARTVLLIVIVVLGLLAIIIPLSLGVMVIAFISPPLASMLMAVVSILTFVSLFYLYFSTAGLIIDDLSAYEALMRSVRLVRNYFWSTFGFIVLINLISAGFGLIWTRIIPFVPAGTVVAIVGNAYIGTGLAMALLVFYRTRSMMMEGGTTLEEILDEI